MLTLKISCSPQKQVETASEILERAAKKGLMKPGKTKTPRVTTEKKHAEAHAPKPAVPTAKMAKLSIKQQDAVISDTEAESKEPKSLKESKPSRSWHGSSEDITPKPSNTKPSKKKSSGDRKFKF